ncbi:porin family protein [Lacihabitans lacunae]|uniref:Porin family protein n=1 Tax=Lacihabitans lacunae TaxID=1028214 RepID=A0ABV7YXV9_9BACT
MKNTSLAFLLILSSLGAFAQKSVGFRGSFTASTLTKFALIENITPDFKLRPAASGAIFLELPITQNFSIQPELEYSMKGFSIREGINKNGEFLGVNIPINAKLTFKTDYIQAPILAKFKFGEPDQTNFYVAVGPAVGVLVNSGLRINVFNIFPVNTNLSKDFFKPVEFSGVAAMGIEQPFTPKLAFFVEGRYQHGFSRILDTPIVRLPVRSRTVNASMGFKVKI